MRLIALFLVSALAASAAGCDQTPPSWQTLITAKITAQYPDYRVVPGAAGMLTVERPGLSPGQVDAAAIGEFCRRGPRDCDYAVDQALIGLQPPPR